jgi:hypothetical protein
MSSAETLRVVLIKPSKYGIDGYVERFRRGFMPNSTLSHVQSLTPSEVDGRPVVVEAIDEYTETNLDYLELLTRKNCTLLALVGVQSHQMHRALDLAALARARGVTSCVVGGPHPMTCETSEVQGRGISFALAEAEVVWAGIVRDSARGELRPTYGGDKRWQAQLDPVPIDPPNRQALGRYVIPMMGIYPARGCPYNCNFCSVIKIAGRAVRGQSVETTMRTLVAARRAGVRLIMFTSDNFNKYPDARQLLQAMIDERLELPFVVQCDAQLHRDEALVRKLAEAGCVQVFIGVESLDKAELRSIRKNHNDPRKYAELIRLCHSVGISTHFSNIIGFPEQDEGSIRKHLDAVRALGPFMASFYILAPIPGTEQYEEFLQADLITERNLDRFDATCLVWRHPRLAPASLEGLLFRCYREFYGAWDVGRKLAAHRWNGSALVYALGVGYPMFARLAAARRFHPMAGGLARVKRDRRADYADIRRSTFGIEQLSLPSALSLKSASDRELYDLRAPAK